MIRLERAAVDILASLPEGHPDRKTLEEYLNIFRAHINTASEQTTLEETNINALIEQLQEEFILNLGIEVVLPRPRPEFLEIQRIFKDGGFKMDPIVYLGRGKVSYALLDRSVRPSYDGGLQLFEDDGFVPILERGRETGKIEVTSWVDHVPLKSRFGVSWNEVHNYVAPEMARVSPYLVKLIEATGIQVRVPRKDEFQLAGRLRYPTFGKADTWEHLYDESGFGGRLVGGGSGLGGLGAVDVCHPDYRLASVAFRLQAVFPSQKL